MFNAIIDAPFIVQFHLIAAVEALILGPFVLYRQRRDRLHRVVGYVWVTNMALAALSSFFIRDLKVIGDFSPIHGLSVLTFISLWQAICAARLGQMQKHRSIMTWLYWGGLVTAGGLSFLPGRIMSQTFHALPSVVSAMAVVVLVIWLGVLLRLQLAASPARRTAPKPGKKKPGRERPGQFVRLSQGGYQP